MTPPDKSVLLTIVFAMMVIAYPAVSVDVFGCDYSDLEYTAAFQPPPEDETEGEADSEAEQVKTKADEGVEAESIPESIGMDTLEVDLDTVISQPDTLIEIPLEGDEGVELDTVAVVPDSVVIPDEAEKAASAEKKKPKKKKSKEKKLSWVEKATLAADSLLSERGAIVLEGKIAAINLEELRLLKPTVWEKANTELKKKYLALEERFINVLRKVELAQLTTLDAQAWVEIEMGFESERDSILDHIEVLTDSLVLAYSPMFSSSKGIRLIEKVDGKNKLLEDYYYRIGVLFLEYAELKYDRETDTWEDLVDSISNLPDSLMLIAEAEIPSEPERDYSLAVDKFTEVMEKYPDSEYADDALYNLAYIKTKSGEGPIYAEGIRMLMKFTERYPDSPYYPEVQFRLGEYYFQPSVNDIAQSIYHYHKVLDFPGSNQYNNALYRLGWCYYQSDDYQQAVNYLTRTIDNTMIEMELGRYSNLMEESIENLSKSFATEIDIAGLGIGTAVDYLKEDPKRMKFFGARMLKRIGDIYQNDYGNFPEAIATYDTILTNLPNDPDAPEISKKMVKCYDLLGDKDKVTEEKLNIFDNYNHASAWADAQTDNDLIREANLLAEMNLREVLRENTVLSNQTKQKEDLERTVELCRTYVEYYPNTTETYRINSNLAIILAWDLKDYLPACIESLNLTRNYPPGKFHEESAKNAVVCAQFLMEQEKADTTLILPSISEFSINVPEEVIRKIPYLGENPLSTGEILYLISLQNYLDLYSRGEQADIYMFNAGILYFKHEEYAASRHYLEMLVNELPQSPKFEEAKKHIMEGYFASKDYANSERLAKEIMASTFSQELTDLAKSRVGESIYSSAKSLGEAEDYLKAGSEFKRVALEVPDYEFADISLWESSQQFKKAAAWDSAIVAMELLVEKAPESEWADKSLNNIAFIYMDNFGDNRRAAEAFEKVFDRYPQSEFAQLSLTNARINYSETEDFNDALRVNEKYLDAFPEAEDAVEVQYASAQLYLKMGNLEKAINSFAAFTQKFPDDQRNIQASYEVGKYHLENGDIVLAKTYFENTINAHREALTKGKEGFPQYASNSLSQLLDWKLEGYFAIDYTSLSTVNARRQQKVELKKELEPGLHELVKLRQREAINAFYNLCRLDEDLARAELHQAMPSLSGEDLRIKRTAILDSSIALYVVAANNYYGASEEIYKWEQAFVQQRSDKIEKIQSMEILQDSVGVLPPDSQVVYEADKQMLEEIDKSLELAAVIQEDCIRKTAEIHLNNARHTTEILDIVIELPIPSDVRGRQEKMYFRETVLNQVVMPTAVNLIDLYRRAYITADTVNANPAWKDSAQTEIRAVIGRMVEEYSALIEQPLKRYRINLGAVRQRIKDEDYSVIGIMGSPQSYLDMAKGFIDSLLIKASVFLVMAHEDTFRAISIAQMDSMYTAAAWRYCQLYSGIIQTNEGYYKEFDRKFGETGEDLYLDGIDLCESIMGDAGDYRSDLLEYVIDGIEKYAINNEPGNCLIRAIVRQDPFTYGHLLGLSLEATSVYSGADWKVNPEAELGFEAVDYDDSDWEFAAIVETSLKPGVLPRGYTLEAVDSTIFVATDSIAIDTTFTIAVDSTAHDTIMWLAIDSIGFDTTIIVMLDSLPVDTFFYLPTDSMLFDTVLYEAREETFDEHPAFVHLDSVAIDTTFRIPVDSAAIDSTIRFAVDSTAVDTLFFLFGDTVAVDTTFYLPGVSRAVDTTIYIQPEEIIVDTTIIAYLDSILIDTTFIISADSTAIDSTMRRAVDSTAVDTLIYIFGDTAAVDTTFLLPGELTPFDTTLFVPGDSIRVDTVYYVYTGPIAIDTTMLIMVDSLAIDSTIRMPADSTAIDTLFFVFGDTVAVDTSIYIPEEDITVDTTVYIITEDRLIDTTFYRIDQWLEIDTTYFVIEWSEFDTTIFLPGDSVARDRSYYLPGELIPVDTTIYVVGDSVEVDSTIYRVTEDRLLDTTIYKIDWVEVDTTIWKVEELQTVDTTFYMVTDSIVKDTSYTIMGDSMLVDTTIFVVGDSLAVDSTIYMVTEDRLIDTTIYVVEWQEIDTTFWRVEEWLTIDTTIYAITDSVAWESYFPPEGDSVAVDTAVYVITDSIAVDGVIYIAGGELAVDTMIYEIIDWLQVDTTIYTVEEWLTVDSTIYTITDSMEVPVLDLSGLYALGAEPIWHDMPAEKLYFRYKFNIDGQPIFGSLITSVDENYVLYLNGRFVGEGSGAENAWLETLSMSVLNFLLPGENIVAVEAIDTNLTGIGLWFKLEYNVMPEDIDEIPIVIDAQEEGEESEEDIQPDWEEE